MCLNSGTSALHISLKLLGANERTEIMMPSLTYVASANSVIYNKADPYFIDVNEDDYGINPETIKNEKKKILSKKGKILFNKKTKKTYCNYASSCIWNTIKYERNNKNCQKI